MSTPPSDPTYRVESLARGLSILSSFAVSSDNLSLTEIASVTGIGKSTTFRLLHTLERAGYVSRETASKRYRLGVKSLELGLVALSGLNLRQVARPILEKLSQTTGETVSLSLLDGLEVVYIDRVRNRSIVGVLLELGSRIPAHCASMGKAMLAHLEPEELTRRLATATLVARTPNSIENVEQLLQELDRVRSKGYALNDEELEVGLRAVAAPIRNYSGEVIAAINLTGNVHTISLERLTFDLAPLVESAAAKISRAMGLAGSEG